MTILEALLGAAIAFAWGMVAGQAITDRRWRGSADVITVTSGGGIYQVSDVTPWRRRRSSLGEDNAQQVSTSPYRTPSPVDDRPPAKDAPPPPTMVQG